jgi:hypothetical protein
MSVVAPPPHDELELLIREARARQRKRWLVGVALTAVVAGGALAAAAVFAPDRPGPRQDRGRPNGIAAVPRCAPGQLRLGRPRFGGAYTAHVVENLTFTNVSGQSCALRGWPTFEVVLSGGRTAAARVGHVRNATSRRAVTTRTVVLRTGAAASFHAIEADGTGLDDICPIPLPRARILVTPPGSNAPAHGSASMPYCHDPRRLLVDLSPVVAGPLDRYSFR